jgi:hypothetical protein
MTFDGTCERGGGSNEHPGELGRAPLALTTGTGHRTQKRVADIAANSGLAAIKHIAYRATIEQQSNEQLEYTLQVLKWGLEDWRCYILQIVVIGYIYTCCLLFAELLFAGAALLPPSHARHGGDVHHRP